MHRTHPLRKKSEPPDEGLLFARVEQAAAAAGIELIGACWPNPPEAIPICASEGVTDGAFGDDVLILFIALNLTRQYREVDRRRFARRALLAYSYWDDRAPAFELGRMLWSDASLAALIDSYFHSPQLIRGMARRLIRLRVAQRDAAEHLNQALRILEEVAA
jgi:hypothetical protein